MVKQKEFLCFIKHLCIRIFFFSKSKRHLNNNNKSVTKEPNKLVMLKIKT